MGDARAPRRLAVLHGILGSAANWRLFAKKLVAERPDWQLALVDLRGHAGSQGAPLPHDLAACARDLVAVEGALGAPFDGVLGHSFGGKVALAFAAARRERPLDQLWVLDANPGARRATGGTMAVVELLERIPQPLSSRERFVELVREAGQPKAIADWLAMQLARGEDGLRLRLDLAVVRALLDDYFRADLWGALTDARETHVVVAGRSDVFDASDIARLEAIRGVVVHRYEDAGHWVHVDAGVRLLADVVAALGASR